MPKCSIVIRAYNEAEHIGKLLDGISKQSFKDVQVILVDSGSTDQTTLIAKEYGAEIVSIEPHEFTFGRSLNIGIQQARADKVVICSAHVFPVYPDWLESLSAPLANPKVAITYGKQRGGDSNQFSEKQIFEHWYPEKSSVQQSHPFCNNANAAIQRSLWEKHPYDENLPALEDLAWARWVHDQGYIVAYVAEAEIVHVHKETWRGIKNRYRREAMAFKQIYPFENFRLSDLFHLFIRNTANDWKEAKKQHCWRSTWMQVILFRWQQFIGTYRGYHQTSNLTWKLKQTFYYPHLDTHKELDENQRLREPISYSDK
jgi:glycosyltransferase involved in cell wall biosynthesis